MGTINNWIQKNLGTRGSGYVSDKDARKLDQQGQQLENDINNIKDTVDNLNKPVEVSVEGSYKNLSTKDKLILGAAGGAAVGGGFGMLKGVVENMGDGATANVQWETHDILDPKVEIDTQKLNIPGTTEVATADGLQKVEVPGASVKYHFEPKITYEKIGEYKTPVSSEAALEQGHMAAVEGLKYAGIGAVVGTAATAAYVGLEKLKNKGDEEKPGEVTQVKYGDETKTVIKAGLTGAAIGGAVGAVDGLMEQGRAGTQTIEWKTPVIEQGVKIGEVPKDASVMIRQDVEYAPDAFKNSQLYRDPSKFDLDKHMKKADEVDVTGNKPDKNLLGQVKMEEHSQELKAQARYGMVGSVLGGIALGGVLGVVSGVALNILKKMVDA